MTDGKTLAVYVLWDAKRRVALMENRPDLRRSTPGQYWVYPGGKLEDGERPVDAMLRECQEETGCRPLAWEILADDLVGRPHPGNKYAGVVDEWKVVAFVVTKWEGEPPQYSLDDHKARMVWADPMMVERDPRDAEFTRNVEVATALLAWSVAVRPANAWKPYEIPDAAIDLLRAARQTAADLSGEERHPADVVTAADVLQAMLLIAMQKSSYRAISAEEADLIKRRPRRL